MTSVLQQLQHIFQDVFDDESIKLADDQTASDIEGWDSLGHINLMIAVEQKFGIKFATAEISLLKDKGQNIGSLVKMISGKVA